MVHKILKLAKSALFAALSKRMGRAATKAELLSKVRKVTLSELTTSEKEQIANYWKGFPVNYDYWRFYKSTGIFAPDLIPDDLYTRYILRVLNPLSYSQSLHVKNVYPILFSELKQPRVLVNRIDNVSYDANQSIMSEEDVKSALTSVYKIIIKPTSGSCGGNGIKLVDTHETPYEEVDKLLKSYGDSYICQEVLKQSELTARFNKSSLNTFRINTLNLNGRITVENIMFRHGRDNSIVDNFGLGGVCCGVNNNGRFIGRAIDSSIKNFEVSPFDVAYKDIVIPETAAIVEVAINAHRRYLPMIGHAAWDFALSEDDEPIFIEVNLGWPGLVSEQLSSGRSIFNERTDEVLEYVKKNQNKLKFTDFLGNWL